MAAAAHAQEKPKAKERRLTNKNVKRVYEELNDIDELVQDVLNVRSLATNRYALSCKRLLPRPKTNDSAIVYEYVTHTCTCIDINIRMWRKGGAVWFSINHGWTLLPLMRSWFNFVPFVEKFCYSWLKHQNTIFPLLNASPKLMPGPSIFIRSNLLLCIPEW